MNPLAAFVRIPSQSRVVSSQVHLHVLLSSAVTVLALCCCLMEVRCGSETWSVISKAQIPEPCRCISGLSRMAVIICILVHH